MPLAMQYPRLYHIVQRKDVSVASVMGHMSLNVAFRRQLTRDKWTDWLNLVERLMMVNLSHESDIFRWKLATSGAFTAKPMYTDLINDGQPFHHKYICKMKVPLK